MFSLSLLFSIQRNHCCLELREMHRLYRSEERNNHGVRMVSSANC